LGIEVSNLALSRGGVKLLEGVSFAVGDGQALILRGPNGIGKTTLLRALVGLQAPVSGQISANPEEFAYFAHADANKSTLTVAENLRFWASVYGADSIEDAVARFDLEALRDRFAAELSAGQKRRLGLARLVLTGRRIWALDEPTVALDRASVGLFGQAVGAHLAGGGIAIIATHIDMGLEAQVLDLTHFRAQVTASAQDFDEVFL
jgi:heme exporter protein A